MALKGFSNVRSGDQTFGKFFPEHTLVVCSSPQATHKGLEKDCLLEPENSTQYTVLRYEGAEFWCFSLADLSVGVQMAVRAPICSLLCRCSQITGKGVHSRRARSHRKTYPGQPAGTLTNLPLKFLYEDWKRVSKDLPGAPFRDTHSLLLG